MISVQNISLTQKALISLLPILFLNANNVFAQSPQTPIDSVKIVFVKDSKVQEVVFKHSDLKPLTTYKEIAPHPSTNPKKLMESWQGFLFSKIISKANAVVNNNTPVSIVGSNGYATLLTFGELKTSGAMLAFLKNGKPIPLSAGGPQSIFPVSKLAKDNKFRIDSWWAWYATTIFIGTFPETIILDRPSALDLSKHPKRASAERLLRYPIGKRENDMPIKAKLDYVLLADLIKMKPKQYVKARSFLGQEVEIKSEFDKYMVIFRADGKPLLHGIGGPVQLCHTDRAEECVFYVREIKTETVK